MRCLPVVVVLLGLTAEASAEKVDSLVYLRDQTVGDYQYSLHCPRAPQTHPLIVIAGDSFPDRIPVAVYRGTLFPGGRGEAAAREYLIEEVERTVRYDARRLADAGFIVAVVAPPQDRTEYAAALEAVLDAVATAPPGGAPGCQPTGVTGAFGFRAGGVAVLELAHRREASSQPLAAVVAAFAAGVGGAFPTLATPALIIEGAGSPGLPSRVLVVRGARSCVLWWGADLCRGGSLDVAGAQRTEILARTLQFMQAYVGGDALARAAVEEWKTEITVEAPHQSQLDSVEVATYKLISLPLSIGGTNQGNDGFALGLRPELVIARLTSNRAVDLGRAAYGYGFGVYGELLRANGDTVLGGGLTCAAYLNHRIGVTASLGAYHRWTDGAVPDSGVSAAVFVGLRGPMLPALDFIDAPLGVRFAAHLGLNGVEERSVIVSAEVDLSIVLGAVAQVIFPIIGR